MIKFNEKPYQKINNKDFKIFLRSKLPKRLIEQIKYYNLKYKNISQKKIFFLINQVINIIINKKFGLPGYKYKPKWERGWGENFLTLKKNSRSMR